jgi:tetratricopeptide (TPR) repeat protein
MRMSGAMRRVQQFMHTSRLPALSFALCLFVVHGAAADQADERLVPLFEALTAATDTIQASKIERRIWQLWLQHENPRAGSLMKDGMTLMAERRLDEARRVFDELVRLEPTFAEAWNKRATVRYLLGDDSGSIDDIARTLQLEPRHFGAISGLGLINLRNGQPRIALEAFERVLEIHPRSPSANEYVRRLRGRFDQAA